jgi:hypothetical protein
MNKDTVGEESPLWFINTQNIPVNIKVIFFLMRNNVKDQYNQHGTTLNSHS